MRRLSYNQAATMGSGSALPFYHQRGAPDEQQTAYSSPPPEYPAPPVQPPPPSIPPRGGGVTWPMNNKKSMGNRRRQRKIRHGRRIPPLFGGHSRSIPQGMIFDVQPLVKSLFCQKRQSPKTGYHFFGGGSKVFASKAPSRAEAHCCHINPWSNGNAAHCGILLRRFESWTVDCWRRRRHVGLGLEPPNKKSAVGCITIWPLLALTLDYLPTAWGRVCH